MQLAGVLIGNALGLLVHVLSDSDVACLFISSYFWQTQLCWAAFRPAHMILMLYFYADVRAPLGAARAPRESWAEFG